MNTPSSPSMFPLWELFCNGRLVQRGHDHDLDIPRIYAMKRPHLKFTLEIATTHGEILGVEQLN